MATSVAASGPAIAPVEGSSGELSQLEIRLKHFHRTDHGDGQMLAHGIGHLMGLDPRTAPQPIQYGEWSGPWTRLPQDAIQIEASACVFSICSREPDTARSAQSASAASNARFDTACDRTGCPGHRRGWPASSPRSAHGVLQTRRKAQRGLDFECFTDDVMPLHILGGGNPDAGARTRTTLEQPFNFKSQQRFGYGKTHAELGGELPARDYLPQTYGASEDALANEAASDARLDCCAASLMFSALLSFRFETENP